MREGTPQRQVGRDKRAEEILERSAIREKIAEREERTGKRGERREMINAET